MTQNGQADCVRISRKGVVKFAFGDDPPFGVDAIALSNEWYQVDQSMRNAEGDIPNDQIVAFTETKRAFVQNKTQQAYGQQPCPVLTLAEVEEFMARLRDEVAKLKLFFAPISPDQPSSPANMEVRFSQ